MTQGHKRATRLTPQGAESRERLLESAIDLISERGYSATSVDAVCRQAGIVKTALYWHFGSKEGLLTAVIDRVATTWIEEIRKRAYLGTDPFQRLDEVISSLRDIVIEDPRQLRLLLSVTLERAEVNAETRDALKSIYERATTAIVEGIEDALETKELPNLDLVAHTILSLLQGALLRRLVDPGTDLERLFRDARRTIILVLVYQFQKTEIPYPGPLADR